jgi:hypothetical protein
MAAAGVVVFVTVTHGSMCFAARIATVAFRSAKLALLSRSERRLSAKHCRQISRDP